MGHVLPCSCITFPVCPPGVRVVQQVSRSVLRGDVGRKLPRVVAGHPVSSSQRDVTGSYHRIHCDQRNVELLSLHRSLQLGLK